MQHIAELTAVCSGCPKVGCYSSPRTDPRLMLIRINPTCLGPVRDRRVTTLDRAVPLGYFRVVSDIRASVGAAGGPRHRLPASRSGD
jgi:hypothetical protein